MSDNLINIKERYNDFAEKGLSFSVSCRYLCQDIDITHYLKIFYILCDISQIESVFGHTTQFSPLYGGRPFSLDYALTDDHIRSMYEKDIHLALTLTNHFFDNHAYIESKDLLKKHHMSGNSIICTNDELAVRIKNDFPDYELKASIMNGINTIEKVEEALEIYDSLTIPMEMNDDDNFLQNISQKDRMILFANAACAYTCPSRTCYLGISQKIAQQSVTGRCSKTSIPRKKKGCVFFDVKKLSAMGYKRFKLIPGVSSKMQGVARNLSNSKKYFFKLLGKKKPRYYFCSYPKCGRTWSRFLIANYLKHQYRLDLNIDLHTIFSLLPNDADNAIKGLARYRYMDNSNIPLILFSHARYNREKFKGEKIIFLLRSVFDVLVSNYFQKTKLLKTYVGNISDFIRDPGCGLNHYLNYLNSWSSHLLSSQVILFSYEMLHADPVKTLSSLCSFLQVDINLSNVNEAVRLSSFERMQDIEQERGIAGHADMSNKPEARRMRKGIVNGYTAYLATDDIQYIGECCNSLLPLETKKLLQQLHIAPYNDK